MDLPSECDKSTCSCSIFTVSIQNGSFSSWIHENLEEIVKFDFALIHHLQSKHTDTNAHQL